MFWSSLKKGKSVKRLRLLSNSSGCVMSGVWPEPVTEGVCASCNGVQPAAELAFRQLTVYCFLPLLSSGTPSAFRLPAVLLSVRERRDANSSSEDGFVSESETLSTGHPLSNFCSASAVPCRPRSPEIRLAKKRSGTS